MKQDYFRALIAVGLLLIQDNKILLMKRHNTGFGDGLYALPGGRIDGNEPMRCALVRECQEELGIIVDPDHLRLSSVLHIAPHFRTPEEVLLCAFVATRYEGQLINKEPHKCSEIAYFPLNNLPSNMLEGSRECLQNYLNNRSFTELHWQSSEHYLFRTTS